MDAVIDLLVNKVAEIDEENVKLMYGIKDQVKELLEELKSFKNITADDDAVLKIQGIVDEAQHAIDQYVVDRKIHLTKGPMRYVEKVSYYKKVNDSAKKIDEIRQRARAIRQDQGGSALAPPNVIQPQHVDEEEDVVVGFDDEAKTIKKRLNDDSKSLAFISIVGMAGLGKTTLTKKVFSDSELQNEFLIRVWVYVSRNMNRKQIFLNILSKFTKKMDDFKYMGDEQLAERIKAYLEGGKYLIVMDDIWEKDHFDYLKIAFPNNQKGSRVLVTTRNGQVATHADSLGNPHKLKFLEDDYSWELLQKKVFGKDTCPSNLESCGKKIVKKCNGLPLALVVIAGALDKDSPLSDWINVDENPFPVINQDNQSYNGIVKLSYDKLDSHKQKCFLYLSAFPIGHEISAWKLIRLWIAEGFIPQSDLNLEGTAESYLKDIVNRSLLTVLKKRADGEIKTCRLHDTLHEFCKSEAFNKKFFLEIDGEKLDKVNSDGYRGLCIHSNIKSFISADNKPSGEHIRSFLSSAKLVIPREYLAAIPKLYPLLSVFDAESLKFEILPKDFYLLYNLRYLAVSTDLSILPRPSNDLWNMQTLIFNTSKTVVEVKADIWSMPILRHILANTSLVFPPPTKNGKGKSGLQTLSTISPSSCTEDIFTEAPNLLKLGVRGNLSELLESKEGICLFDNVQKLRNLENLKLLHEVAKDQAASTLGSFPRAEKFPSKLRKLTLNKTCFEWKDICILASLEKLEVLKLEESSVKGECWEVNNDAVFKSLRFLRIGKTDLATWSCGKDNFPVLKFLYVSHCESLNAIPLAFKDVKSLKLIDLFSTNKNAANSAREIRDHKAKGFELVIYPPTH